MPSSIADPLYERLLRAYPADRAYTRDDWTDAPMPSPVQHFLVQLLQHQCRHEVQRLRTARTAWVEYDHPEMERATHVFEEAMSTYAQIPRSEWPGALKQATHHVTSFLVRPTHVLTEFVFGDRTTPLDLDQVEWRMGFFGPYAYLREAIEAFTRQRGLHALRRDQFERLLVRIDERLTDDYDADRWLRLLDPLFKIARVATDSDKVPVRLLRTFFGEKNAADVVRRLQTFAASGPDHVGPKQLFRLIQNDEASTRTSQREAAPSRPTPRPDVPPLRSTSTASSSASTFPQRDAPSAGGDEALPADASAETASAEEIPAPEAPAPTASTKASSPSIEEIYGQNRSASPSESDAPSESDGDADGDGSAWYDEVSDGDDRDDIWGVAGPARPAGTPGPTPDDDDTNESTPLWKRFQQGGNNGSSASDRAEPDGGTGTPLWARFQSGRGGTESSLAEADGDAETGPASTTEEDPASAEEAATADASTTPDRLTALEHAVLGASNPPQRAVYVRQLFGGSMDDYRHVLNQLHAADGWGRASQIIARDVFRAHKVNIYSDAAVHFTNAVEERFREKG